MLTLEFALAVGRLGVWGAGVGVVALMLDLGRVTRRGS